MRKKAWVPRERQRTLQIGQPAGLDVERQNQRALALRGRVLVGMVFPGVDEHGRVVGQWRALAAHADRTVGPTRLDQDVAVVMGMADRSASMSSSATRPKRPWNIFTAEDTATKRRALGEWCLAA